jgi:hypothetical protein
MEERQSAQRNSGRQGPHSAVWRLSGCLLKIGVPPITDDLATSLPPPPKPGPYQAAIAVISSFTQRTVPVPTPSTLACRQLLTDALDDILAHRTTPEPFPLAPCS